MNRTRSRVAAAELLTAKAREDAEAAQRDLDALTAASGIDDSVGDSWPYASAPSPMNQASTAATRSSPEDIQLPPAYREPGTPSATRTFDGLSTKQLRGPADWQGRRTRTTWGVAALAVLSSLSFHWLSQIIVGAGVGAAAGPEGLASITSDEFSTLNAVVIGSTLITTVIVLAYSAYQTYEALSWDPTRPSAYGMNWWRYCWSPILLGTGIHALVFWIGFGSITS